MERKWKRLDRKVALFGLFGWFERFTGTLIRMGRKWRRVGSEKDGFLDFLENGFWEFKLLDSVLLADKINV